MKAKQGGSAKNDADGLFGQMVAGELRQISGRSKIILKHKIQSTIFECQIEAWDELQPKRQPKAHMMSPPSTPSYGNSLQFNAYGSPIHQPPQQSFDQDESNNIGYYTNLVTKKMNDELYAFIIDLFYTTKLCILR